MKSPLELANIADQATRDVMHVVNARHAPYAIRKRDAWKAVAEIVQRAVEQAAE